MGVFRGVIWGMCFWGLVLGSGFTLGNLATCNLRPVPFWVGLAVASALVAWHLWRLSNGKT